MIVFLSSDRANQVTGQTINVDGGFVMHLEQIARNGASEREDRSVTATVPWLCSAILRTPLHPVKWEASFLPCPPTALARLAILGPSFDEELRWSANSVGRLAT